MTDTLLTEIRDLLKDIFIALAIDSINHGDHKEQVRAEIRNKLRQHVSL